jgi:serine/threonine protein kinase
VDVYSLGNIFYSLLQGEEVFQDVKSKQAQKLIMEGIRPSFYPEVWNSTDPIDMVIKEAMIKCHQHKSTERATAREVSNLLKAKLEELDPGRTATWEKPV